ncbi:MAG: hypothetical protein V1839_04260 [archaeon]
MDKKYFLVALLLIAVMFVSGCTSNAKQTASQVAAVGGSQGLALTFMPGQPPAEVYENNGFQIAVNVENKGEFAIDSANPAKIFLTGIDPTSFELDPQGEQDIDKLAAVNKVGSSTIPGGQKPVIWKAKRANVPVTSTFTAQALAIYRYQTNAIATVCLKENIYQQTSGGTELCKLSEVKAVQNLGAPVKVSSIEEMPTGFKIKISNVGGGAPFVKEDGSYTATSDSNIDKYNELNKVKIKASIPHVTVECPSDELMLVNGAAETFCQADLTAPQEYTDLLTVTLDYGYRQMTSTTFKVTHVPGGGGGSGAVKGQCSDVNATKILNALGGCDSLDKTKYLTTWNDCNCGA